MENCHYLRDWLNDSTEPSIRQSPFLERSWQTYVLLLSNLPRCALDIWYTCRCFSSACRAWHSSAVLGLASGFVLVWSLLFLDGKRQAAQARALTIEAVTAVSTAMSFAFQISRELEDGDAGSHRKSTQILSPLYLLLCIVFFFALKVHPFCVLLLVMELVMLLLAGAESVFWFKFVRGQYVFVEGWQVKLAMLALWVVAWSWYLVCFSRKIHVVKNSHALRAVQCVNVEEWSFRSWWLLSTERAVTDSPIMARNSSWACAGAICLWLSHMICLDMLAASGCVPLWNYMYISAAGSVACLCMPLVASAAKPRSTLWIDLPLALSSCTPSLLNAIWACLIPETCAPDNLVSLSSRILFLNLPQSLAVVVTLSLASVHPLPLGLAVLLLILTTAICFSSSSQSARRGEVEISALVLACVLAHFSCHSLDYVHVTSELGKTRRTRSSISPSMDATEMQSIQTTGSTDTLIDANQSCVGPLGGFRKENLMFREIIAPEDLQEVRDLSGATSTSAVPAFRPAVAVVRHGEREDAIWNSSWFESEDGLKHPYDCPITAEGVKQARDVATSFAAFSNFGIVVCSPYLRCVQTAVVIAEQLGLMVLLDHELGEVLGRAVFSDMSVFKGGVVPWRSRRRLYESIKDWTVENWRGKPPVEHVCWKRILGKPPAPGESLSDARKRYAKRFLTYLARSRRAEKNLVVVSHGHMMEACLKVLPSTSSQRVTSVPYCGGFMAQLSKVPEAMAPGEELSEEVKLSESSKSDEVAEKHLGSAQLAWWDVKLFGIELGPSSSDNGRRKFLTQLQDGTLSWDYIQKLLNELPETVEKRPEPRVRANSASTDLTTLTNATDTSMFLFRRPSFDGSVAFSDASAEPTAPHPERVEKGRPITLQSNPLLNRRNKLGQLGARQGHDAASSEDPRSLRRMPSTDDTAAISAKEVLQNPLRRKPSLAPLTLPTPSLASKPQNGAHAEVRTEESKA